MGDVALLQVAGDPVGHLPAQFGEVVAGAPPVQHTVRVVHLAVAHQVHHGEVLAASVPAAHAVASDAARAAAGRAAAMRSTARSSWAVETNQDSKAEGGR